MVATRVVCARFGGEDGRRLGASWRIVCGDGRSFGGCIAEATPSPALPRCGLRPAGEGVERREIGQWLVNGLRVWWAFPVVGGGASTTLRVYISIGGCIAGAAPPPPRPPPLRASPCRGGGSSAAGIRTVNVCAGWCAEAHPMVVCWVTRCALTQPTGSGWGSCLAFRSSFCWS